MHLPVNDRRARGPLQLPYIGTRVRVIMNGRTTALSLRREIVLHIVTFVSPDTQALRYERANMRCN